MKGKYFVIIACWLAFVFAGQFLKFTLPLGEHSASISCVAIALPLLACFLPARFSLPIIGAVWLALHAIRPIPLTMGLPTLLASLSWRFSKEQSGMNLFLHVLFPLCMMALFIAAPHGREAWSYSLYWLIPVALYFFKPTLYSKALQSTFVAHATGSVIWAYLMPLAGTKWLSLIPVVAIERLLAAAVAVAMVQTLRAIQVRIPEFGIRRNGYSLQAD